MQWSTLFFLVGERCYTNKYALLPRSALLCSALLCLGAVHITRGRLLIPVTVQSRLWSQQLQVRRFQMGFEGLKCLRWEKEAAHWVPLKESVGFQERPDRPVVKGASRTSSAPWVQVWLETFAACHTRYVHVSSLPSTWIYLTSTCLLTKGKSAQKWKQIHLVSCS